jgi:hypothetical protein
MPGASERLLGEGSGEAAAEDEAVDQVTFFGDVMGSSEFLIKVS